MKPTPEVAALDERLSNSTHQYQPHEKYREMRTLAISLEERAIALRAWKAEQIAVDNEWKPEVVADLLRIPLGQSIRAAIEPRIRELLELKTPAKDGPYWQAIADCVEATTKALTELPSYDGFSRGELTKRLAELTALFTKAKEEVTTQINSDGHPEGLMERLYDEDGVMLQEKPYIFKRLMQVGQEMILNSVPMTILSCTLEGKWVITRVKLGKPWPRKDGL